MTYIKINDEQFEATINGRLEDLDWDSRESKSITLTMDYNTAINLFIDNLAWSIVSTVMIMEISLNGEETETEKTVEYDNSDYCVAGDITDHRDGTITIKMGKLTELEEAYELLLGGAE